MEVGVSFTCSYQQLKNLLHAADISEDRIVIDDISITEKVIVCQEISPWYFGGLLIKSGFSLIGIWNLTEGNIISSNGNGLVYVLKFRIILS